MSTYIEIANGSNSHLIAQSISDIRLYQRTKERSSLESAQARLQQVEGGGQDSLQALYYSAIINDFLGKAKDAVKQLEGLLKSKPDFAERAKYQLALAYYHRYSRPYLEKAAKRFREVIKNTDDEILKILAQAGLAQTFAMRMIQPDPMNPDLADARKYFRLSTEQYQNVIRALEFLGDNNHPALVEVRWEVYNGHGMALMYHTDYFGGVEEKVTQLKLALREFKKADRESTKNWANYCDMGSAHMRLGHWTSSKSEFQEAHKFLREVIDTLRPNYGFALYELGRTYRLMGRFKTAVKYFDKALAIEYAYRDVSDGRINIDRGRALDSSKEYP